MNPQRRYLNLHVGNVAQLVGAALTCYGVDHRFGLAWSMILAGVVLAVLANFEWDSAVWRLPLPAFDTRPIWQRGSRLGKLAIRLRRGTGWLRLHLRRA
jgi:hypothetical protein